MNQMDKWLSPFTSNSPATVATPAINIPATGSNGSENSGSSLAFYQYMYQERVAIMEFDAGMQKAESELAALKDVTLEYVRDHLPDVLVAITGPPEGVGYG